MNNNLEITVVHNPTHSRFEADLNGDLAVVDYRMDGNTMLVTHTGVPPAYEGRGIAGKLTRVVLDYAQSQGYHVQPLCSYTASYIRRHPEYQDLTRGG